MELPDENSSSSARKRALLSFRRIDNANLYGFAPLWLPRIHSAFQLGASAWRDLSVNHCSAEPVQICCSSGVIGPPLGEGNVNELSLSEQRMLSKKGLVQR